MMDDAISKQIELYKDAEKDAFFLDELAAVLARGDAQELYERFYTELEFGTGGIRGIIGAGTNRLNTLVVQRVAEGWARYINAQFKGQTPKVVIAYDSRNFSEQFAKTVSEILTGHGIKVYCYPQPRPTPQLSYTIRMLKAQSGLVITASHNPPKYNGLKIYWDDGAQVIVPQDRGIMDEIAKAQGVKDFAKKDLVQAEQEGLYELLGEEYDKNFQSYCASVLLNPKVFEADDDFKVVYTPLHGTGAFHMERLMQQFNIKGVIEPSQAQPDGNFPTVKFPNPEEASALANAIATAKKIGANLVVATDPDADRVGLAEKSGGEYILLSGNQIGALLLDYILQIKKENGTLASNSVFVNTIVTTHLQEKIASKYGVETYKTYTGFKNIAEKIEKIMREKKNYVFSCEESYGYLANSNVRDKDGISISLLCIEMAKFYAIQSKSLVSRLQEIFVEFGYHREYAINKVLEGAAGKEKIVAIMEKLRKNPPANIGTEKVTQVADYLELTISTMGSGKSEAIEGFLGRENVLVYTTESGNTLCVRPSGTEPKIKFYFLYSMSPLLGERAASNPLADMEEAKAKLDVLIKSAETSLEGWLQ